ncbi:MAG: ABC transporter permease [Actinomycetota bacterium]
MFWVQLIIAGAASGGILALAGMGIVLTYKATGVFNLAHGAIGVFVAYVLYQLNVGWHVPLPLAAPIAIGLVGPGLGLALERLVFRPLQREGATTIEKLTASLGVLIVLVGIVYAVWTGQTRVGPHLFPVRSFAIGELRLPYDRLAQLALLGVTSVLLWAFFRHTRLGLRMRAVVDSPDLAELVSIDVDRVGRAAWAMGAGLAGLSGVIIASGSLDPYRMSLFMLATFSIAVVARLTSLPLAAASGVLLLGVGRALVEQVNLAPTTVPGSILQSLVAGLPVVVLFGALIIYRHLDVLGETAERLHRLAAARRPSAGRTLGATGIVAAGLILMPAFLSIGALEQAQRFLAFTIIFASIVVATGFSGQITLGQAGFAGVAAWAAVRVANSWHVPVIAAMVAGGLVAALAGLAAGYPAGRRRGLFLALTTLALNMVLYQGILINTVIAGGPSGLQVARPSIAGIRLDGPFAFYYFELALVGLSLLLAHNLRSGAIGRAFGAIRDSELGARSVGVDPRAYKLLIFAASAFLAGIGGILLTQQARVFSSEGQFFPLYSLFWFAAAVVGGITSLGGALLAAFVWVMLDVFVGTSGISQLVIGLAALMIGRLGGRSLIGLAQAGLDRFVSMLGRVAVEARSEQRRRSPAGIEQAAARYVPSALAVRALRGDLALPGSEFPREGEGT